jgi:hypothetical protein
LYYARIIKRRIDGDMDFVAAPLRMWCLDREELLVIRTSAGPPPPFSDEDAHDATLLILPSYRSPISALITAD